MASPKPLDQLSPAYRARIERGLAAGFSRSQARGHAKRSEAPITAIKAESRASGRPLREILASATGFTKERTFRKLANTRHRAFRTTSLDGVRDIIDRRKGSAYGVFVKVTMWDAKGKKLIAQTDTFSTKGSNVADNVLYGAGDAKGVIENIRILAKSAKKQIPEDDEELEEEEPDEIMYDVTFVSKL